MKVVESHSLETSVNKQWVKGWITEAQVAKEEGFSQLQYMPRAEDLAPDDLG